MPARTPWSRMRFWSLTAALILWALIAVTYVSALAYEGDFRAFPEFWLTTFAALVASTGFIGALIRDQIVEAVKGNAQALEDLPLHIADYGDRREVAGHQLAARVSDNQRRRGSLHPID